MNFTSTSARALRDRAENEPGPRSEYPRPDFDRSHSWRSLNGWWEFQRGAGDAFDEQILVPFAWETVASGVEAHWLDRAVYRRSFSVPREWAGSRTILRFGAVHHEAAISVDGRLVGTHTGGYTPFEFDITDFLVGNEGATDEQPKRDHALVVEVSAPIDKRQIAHGKQRSLPPDDYDSCAFTPSSGIWQPVWIEARPATYLEQFRVVAADNLQAFLIQGRVAGPGAAQSVVSIQLCDPDSDATLGGATVSGSELAASEVAVSVPAPRLWSPQDPYLYRLKVEVTSPDGSDHVVIPAGLRSIAVHADKILLNGVRISLRGVLDQGYWPESGITAPTDEAFVTDLEVARRAGFNLVRKHLKLEDPRFYFHADRLGMLVWAEPPSTGRFSEASTEAFTSQIEPMVRTLGNHPSVVVWGLYNEEWGLDWSLPDDPKKQHAVLAAVLRLKGLDDSRPVVDNSGWTHVATDLVDWHVYDEHPAGWAAKVAAVVGEDSPHFPVAIAVGTVVQKALMVAGPRPLGVPLVNSEFGGGWTSMDRGWNLHWQTQELRRHDTIAGWVWTELADVEHESAGIVDSLRRWKDDGGRPAAHVNGETAVVFDLVPIRPGKDIATSDGVVRIAAAVSHHGPEPVEVDILVGWGEPLGLEPMSAERTGTLSVEPFRLSSTVAVESRLPEGWASGRLHVLLEIAGRRVGQGMLDVVREPAGH